ncbi:hypothetical protein EST38_g2959 [Candolleomyces aberdarensis]|uniref:TLC domain-containing protein n=1 Tax=Candolleomyces aberdarensis TaxID=2316362 RepID=A0A4Q2DRS1_9AGAR|nr:hypothetical protein EST38_g2959 [Candolleomyces aberdarensis]
MAPRHTHPGKRPAVSQLSTAQIEKLSHYQLDSPSLPQTPPGSSTPSRTGSPASSNGFLSASGRVPPWWLQWAINPYVALKLLATPVVLYFNWKLVTPYVAPDLPNPFAPIFLLSGYIADSKPEQPRYAKSYNDLIFLAYYIVFFSFVREYLAIKVSRPVARYFGLRKEGKIVRFAEQFYALVYFAFFGAWGYFSYWLQQLIVLVLGLEKPRKDYNMLVAHHFITLWLVGWSYFLNMTIIGSAVYMSMDIPDAFFAASKLLNYIQWERAKMVAFGTFIGVWTYFRHYLNFKMLWSVWYESHLAPEDSKQWNWSAGTYLVSWLPTFVFVSIFALQMLNLFWYWLIWKILIKAIITRTADDERSDDEDEDEPTANEKHD